MYYIKIRYIDNDGIEHNWFDGYDILHNSLTYVESPTDKNVCLYMSKKSAINMKKNIDDMLDDEINRKLIKKRWKAKIIPIEDIPDSFDIKKSPKATINGACKYYTMFCL